LHRNHFEGSRGGRLTSRRHAGLQQASHSWISYPIHHFRGREPAGDTWQDWGLIWCRPDGRPIGTHDDWEEWKALLSEAGITKDARLHDARHTCGTLLGEQHVDMHVIQRILGHAQISTTRIYTDPTDPLTREAVDRIGRILWPDETDAAPAGRAGDELRKLLAALDQDTALSVLRDLLAENTPDEIPQHGKAGNRNRERNQRPRPKGKRGGKRQARLGGAGGARTHDRRIMSPLL
jgi:Phage integrase family